LVLLGSCKIALTNFICMLKQRLFYFILLLTLTCCRKPYNPPVIASTNSYLVVEGVINSGGDSTIIKLSRTVNLNAQVTTNPVADASIKVESDQNGSWPLIADGRGSYYTPALNLSPAGNYRIHITTSDGKQYVSDYQPIKATPPIDSIGYTVSGSGINLYVNSHDPANNTRYYRWEYNEAWIFHAKYDSQYMLDSATQTIVYRPTSKQVYFCYGNDASTNLLLGSTAKLSKDVVYQSPLTSIPFNSEKLEFNYLIYLKQYALTPEAYTFYLNMQKNTEQLGSIFDAEPSELQGNIHNINNAAEPVIGWISVTNVQTKKAFVTDQVVPSGTVTTYPADCAADTALYVDKSGSNDVLNELIDPPLTALPISDINPTGIKIIGYTYSTLTCTDCTLRGKIAPPWYWK
jgi:hypothetical protein